MNKSFLNNTINERYVIINWETIKMFRVEFS